uniref:Uncharacterized protein n=1 Tax=viral metagenome TaxID=1070528 RepID=A0A6H1ZS84_9ZZZZ
MADKTWKAVERRIAAWFKTQRVSLSGGNSKISRSDTMHSQLFVEIKHRQKHALWSLYRQTKTLAEKENKLPILAIHETGGHGFLLVVHCDDYNKLKEII